MTAKKVERIINFYECWIENDSSQKFAIECFKLNKTLIEIKDRSRYLVCADGGYLYVSTSSRAELGIAYIQGKIRKIRMDNFPEIMHTFEDRVRDIEAEAAEGVVETTHFVIDLRYERPVVAMEHNQFGPKMGDFSRYLQHISAVGEFTKIVHNSPIIDEKLLRTLQERILNCHRLTIKVNKDDQSQLESLHHGFASGMDACEEFGETKSYEMVINFDDKNHPGTPRANNNILSIVRGFLQKPEYTEHIEKLNLEANDAFNDGKLESFDLLLSKIKRKVIVSRREKSRTVVSAEMFEKLHDEIKIFRRDQ